MSSYIGWKIVDDSADDGTLLVESPQGHRRRVLVNATMTDHIGETNEKVEPFGNSEELPRITETWHWNSGDYAAGEAPYMGRSKFGKWVTVEHAADIIVEYQQQLADLKFERRFCPSPERWAEVHSELAAYKERAVVQDGELLKVTCERDEVQGKLAEARAECELERSDRTAAEFEMLHLRDKLAEVVRLYRLGIPMSAAVWRGLYEQAKEVCGDN